jgi:hypothetical protein
MGEKDDVNDGSLQDGHGVAAAPLNANELPRSIREDFNEAKACIEARAPNAGAMMCRRLLSRLAIFSGAKDDTTTGPQLDYLKENHLIADDLYEAARMVKALGDEGAHPPDEVTMEEATAAFRVTCAILQAMQHRGKPRD